MKNSFFKTSPIATSVCIIIAGIIFIYGFSVKDAYEKDLANAASQRDAKVVSIAKFAPITHHKSSNGTVVAVNEAKGIYHAFVRVDGDRDGVPLAFSGKPLKVGDRVILWHGTFGRSYDGTNFNAGGFFDFPVAELIPEPQAKK